MKTKTKTFPKGTRESSSKGFMTNSGTKHFVHITNTNEFYRSYPVWRSKNPRTNHVYDFQGHLATGNQIMSFLRENMKQTAAPRRSPRRHNSTATTTASGNGNASNPYRRVTRSMTKRSRTSPATTNNVSRSTTRRRKQTHPRRSYFE